MRRDLLFQSRHIRKTVFILLVVTLFSCSIFMKSPFAQEKEKPVGPRHIPPEILEKLPEEARDLIMDRPDLLQKSPGTIKKDFEKKRAEDPSMEAEEVDLSTLPEKRYRWQESGYVGRLFLPRLIAGEREALIHFGHEIFAREEGKFEPLPTLPVSPDYLVGPGDEILITMWGRIEGLFPATIDSEGKIYIAKFGTLSVAGKTYRELKDYIKKRVSVVTGASVDVSITGLKGIRVFILGEVESPGAYNISSLATAIHALYRAGRIKDTGSLRSVTVIRNGKTVETIDLYRLLLYGDISADIRLLQGDTVFVPTVSHLVAVSGEVRRQGIYELKEEEALSDLITMAGGFSPTAYKRKVTIERLEDNTAARVIDINAESLENTEQITRLKDGDIIRVSPILYEDINAVILEGNVVHPGKYEHRPGMKIRDILPGEQAFLPDTYFDYATLTRLVPPDMHREIIPVNLRKAVLEADEVANIQLKPYDRIDVFFRQAFVDIPEAAITGEVRKPGTYEKKEGMRVSDLIKLGGDVKKTAYMKRGEILRILEDRGLKTLYFDVAKAIENEEKNDILLEDEDWVIIHSIFETRFVERVNILGAVKNPGEYTLTEGMKISDLVFKAGGLLESSYVREGEIIRYDVLEGEEAIAETMTIYPGKALAGEEAADIPLQHQDRVIIKEIPEYAEKIFVAIRGEVRFPGVYGASTGERLSSIIDRAGGFKGDAYLKGAVFTRESVRKVQQERIDKLIEDLEHRVAVQESGEFVGIIDPEDIKIQQEVLRARTNLLEKLKTVRAKGRIVITLRKLDEFKGSDSDLVLEDNDTIFIPKKMNVVNVVGEVFNPTAVTYNPERRKAGHYLDLVGGPTDNADAKQIFIIKADGTVISKKNVGNIRKAKMDPGDTLAVPEKILKGQVRRELKDWTQILFQIAVTAGVLVAIF